MRLQWIGRHFVLTLAVAAVAHGALQRSDVLFYAPLNGTADAQIAAGDGKALPGLNARYVPGLGGVQALGPP